MIKYSHVVAATEVRDLILTPSDAALIEHAFLSPSVARYINSYMPMSSKTGNHSNCFVDSYLATLKATSCENCFSNVHVGLLLHPGRP